MYLIDGNEDTEELLALTYGLEDANSSYYSMLSDRATTSSVRDLFHMLSDMEGKHKCRIWEMYEKLAEQSKEQAEFESTVVAKTLENGKTLDQMVLTSPEFFDDQHSAVEFSMALETDALDLYLRMAQKVGSHEAATLFLSLAEEEKNHLENLSTLFSESL
jgi:rubrerythrin